MSSTRSSFPQDPDYFFFAHRIALQYFAGVVKFRKVEIKPL